MRKLVDPGTILSCLNFNFLLFLGCSFAMHKCTGSLLVFFYPKDLLARCNTALGSFYGEREPLFHYK